MNYSLHSLSSSTSDSSASLLAAIDLERYIFDTPEGCQRNLVQGGHSLKNADTIFLSSLRSEDANGLSGMIFTLADRGTRHLTVVGPENTAAFIASFRHFLVRNEMTLQIIERSMNGRFDSSKPIIKTGSAQVFCVAAVPDAPAEEKDGGKAEAVEKEGDVVVGAEQQGSTPAEQAEAVLKQPTDTPVPAFGTIAQQGADETDPVFAERKRKRSLSHLSSIKWNEPLPTPSSSAHPYSRLPSEFGPHVQHALLSGMFDKVEIVTATPNRTAPLSPGALRATTGGVATHVCTPVLARKNDSRLTYILVGPEKRGKVDLQRVKALGVDRMQISTLTKGQSVMVTSPTTGEEVEVQPHEILGPSTKATATIIVHCPDASYVDTLVTDPLWNQWVGEEGDAIRPVHVMWHKTGILDDERYRAWMARFGKDVIHLSGDSQLANDHLNATSFALSSTSLSILDPTIFKRAHCGLPPAHEPISTPDQSKVYPILPRQVVDIIPGPRKLPRIDTVAYSGGVPDAHRLGVERVAQLPKQELLAQFEKTIPQYVKEVEKAQAAVRAGEKNRREKQPGDDVVVTALGTGSSMPSKYRNVSSTHIYIPGFGGVLLDAGEGTLGQLRRLHGPERVIELVRDLRVVFISHLHADHHSGLTSLLRFRTEITTADEQITLIGSERLLTQMREISDFTNVGLDRLRFIDGWHVINHPGANNRPAANLEENLEWVQKATGLTQFNSVKVDHRGHACWGAVLSHQDGWKLVYSGDTMPCETLVAAGKDATLLIHEATLADDTPESLAELAAARRRSDAKSSRAANGGKTCLELAKSKGHSTFSQAVNVGRRMRSQHTLLTHFSQRYPKNPISTVSPIPLSLTPAEQAHAKQQVVALAADFVSVAIGDMWKLPLYTDAIAALYVDEDEGSVAGSESAPAPAKAQEGLSKKAQDRAARKAAAVAERADATPQRPKQKKAKIDSKLLDQPATKG